MYDVTRPITFRNIEKWYNLLQEHVRGDVEVAIVSIYFLANFESKGILKSRT